MTRLDELRSMRDFIDREIATELGGSHILIELAADLYEVSVGDILGGSRHRRVAHARQGAAWLLRRTGMSWRDIGNALGLDHSTVGYSIRKVDASPGTRALLVRLEATA
jgi:chromosomal replication initiation ATPase DnaA